MTLFELSAQYRSGAESISQRIRLLRQRLKQTTDYTEAQQLRQRIHALQPMLHQCRQMAELTAHYYDRGYKRNELYTL
jgi:primosomal protein N''